MKVKKILKLFDPYPHLQYEAFCYVKAFFGFTFIILGIWFLLSPLFQQNTTILVLTAGLLLLAFGLWLLWRIKLVRRLIKEIKR